MPIEFWLIILSFSMAVSLQIGKLSKDPVDRMMRLPPFLVRSKLWLIFLSLSGTIAMPIFIYGVYIHHGIAMAILSFFVGVLIPLKVVERLWDYNLNSALLVLLATFGYPFSVYMILS